MRNVVRRLDVEMRHAIEGTPRDDRRHTVDMTRDDMAAELIADFERAFEIEPRAGSPLAGSRAHECLGGGIDLEGRAVARLPDRDRRETGPGTGDRRTDRNCVSGIIAGDADAPEIAAIFRREHLA